MRRITITFDNGPVPGGTEQILDVLAARDTRAVFFSIGTRLQEYEGQALLSRIGAEGHRIGNHTMHHERPLGEYENEEEATAEVSDLDALLTSLGQPTRLFRPQGRGIVGQHLLRPGPLDYLIRERFTVVTWNNVPGDWLEPRRDWFETALATLDTQDWSVVVLHDHCQMEMLDLLVGFLDEVRERGLEVRTDFPKDCILMADGELKVPKSEICRCTRDTDGYTFP